MNAEQSQDNDFGGLRVAAFESRRADEMARMISRLGGQAHVSPSLRESPLENNSAAVEFAKALITGQIEIVLLMTGVGFQHLVAAVEKHIDRQRFLAALSDITTIARGPKPSAAMKKVGLSPTFRVPEPNTWREVLTTIDANLPIANQKVAVQEYGKSNPSLVAGLEARGARVVSVPVYTWQLPLDPGPLRDNVQALVAGRRDLVLFTSAHQVTNLLACAADMGLESELRQALRQTVIGSIGPTTSERLRQESLVVDLESTRSKMAHLVTQASQVGHQLIRKRLRITNVSVPQSDCGDTEAPWYDSPFMKACRREECDTIPIWLMRQAGRYMAEYREIRAKTSFLQLCKNPQLCAEIMVTAVERLGVDAAIIFSDLLPILEPMGLDLEYAVGEGPVIHNPVREPLDVDRVVELENVEALDFVFETVRQTRAALPADIPVIGFAGAPFTLASYAIEGGASRNYLHTKTLMYRDAGAWNALMQRFVRSVTAYLNAQIAAGAQCVQLFDSWAGCLNVDDYRQFVLPHVQQIIRQIAPGIPVINFATGNPALLPCLADARPAVVGVDWRVRLDEAWHTVGYDYAVQGNLDPTTLMAEPAEIVRRARQIVKMAAGRPGHIFNLGHGVLPQTPVDNVLALVDAVHQMGPDGNG